jgi:hypothetical protein
MRANTHHCAALFSSRFVISSLNLPSAIIGFVFLLPVLFSPWSFLFLFLSLSHIDHQTSSSSTNVLHNHQFLAMPEAGSESKSPKLRRSLSKGDTHHPGRQVHFDSIDPKPKSFSTANRQNTKEEDAPKNTQPDSHPQVGEGPLPNLNRPPQWYTAANPARTFHLSGAQPAYTHASPPILNHFQQPFVHNATYLPATNMGDYQNCVPPPTGVNFQPPVPDTTFGPIPHVYVPRFDGAPMYAGGGIQVCSPSFSFLPTSYLLPAAPSASPTITVITPKTFYVGGHNYYASARCGGHDHFLCL